MAPRTLTPEESALAAQLLANARRAMAQISSYDQARVDRLCQAVGWAGANPETAARLANMSVDESGLGSRELLNGDPELALTLHREASEKCFIAASVNFPVLHEPVIALAD